MHSVKSGLKGLFLGIVLLAAFSSPATAQFNCLPSGITFDQQSQIDSFPINYPTCLNITGHLLIFPATPGAITDLTPLSQLESVGTQLWINDNSGLPSFAGLENVTTVGSHLRIRYNSNITDLTGLNGITSVGGELDISDNLFSTLDGLDSLETVGSNFTLANNSLLTSVQGLGKLSSLGGYMAITNDTLLTTLSGLDNIDHTTITQLQIANCKFLTMCVIQSICDFLAVPTNFASIGGNGFGCLTRPQIENGCQSLSTAEPGRDAISIYPNPVTDFAAVSGLEQQQSVIRITDYQGRLVMEKESRNGLLDLRHLPKGIYLLTVEMGDTFIVEKLLKH